MDLLKNQPTTSKKNFLPNEEGELNDRDYTIRFKEIGPEIRTSENGELYVYHQIDNNFSLNQFPEDSFTVSTSFTVHKFGIGPDSIKMRTWLFGLNVDSLEISSKVQGNILDCDFDFEYEVKDSNTSTVRLLEEFPIISEDLVKPVKEIIPSYKKAIENSFKKLEEAIIEQNPEVKSRTEMLAEQRKTETTQDQEIKPKIEKKEKQESIQETTTKPQQEVSEATELDALLKKYGDLLI